MQKKKSTLNEKNLFGIKDQKVFEILVIFNLTETKPGIDLSTSIALKMN